MLITLALIVCIGFYAVSGIMNLFPAQEPPIPTDNNIENTPEAKSNKVKIQLAGNVSLNDVLLSSNSDAYGKYNFDTEFASLKKILDGDLKIFNLQGMLDAYGNNESISASPIFNYPKEIAVSAKNAGFNLCVAANKKSAFLSTAGIKNTATALKSTGLSYVGISLEGEENYILREVNGIKIAVLAYTDEFSNQSELEQERISTLDLSDVESSSEKVKADVEKVRGLGAEIVIASLNWGEEIAAEPTQNQRKLADRIVKSGVDIIMGTLSNVFQPITYKNIVTDKSESKTVVIAYSLGNILAHPTVTTGQKSQESAVINVFVERDKNGKAYISSAECRPVYIYAKQLTNGFEHYVLPCGEFDLSGERPEIFVNDSDWTSCKNAYKNIEDIIKKSSANGMQLGIS